MWPFRKKSFVPGEPRQGFARVEATPSWLTLYSGQAISYNEIYKASPSLQAVVRTIATNAGELPQHVFGRSTRARLDANHPTEKLLRAPNPATSGFEFRRDIYGDLCIYANSYHLKIRDNDDNVIALVRIPPDRVSLISSDSTETSKYKIRFNAGEREFDARDVVHIRDYNPSDPRIGVSKIESLRAVLAEERAASEHRAGFWKNSARREGVIKRPLEAPEWNGDAMERFRVGWESTMSGGENSGRTGILADGMDWVDATFSPKDAEFIAGRTQAVQLVALVYGCPLQLVGQSDRNTQQARRQLYQDCVLPLASLVDASLNRDLIAADARRTGSYIETIFEENIRGDVSLQTEVLAESITSGLLTPNEARARINLPPVEGGDTLRPPSMPQSASQSSPAPPAG